jgi:hypothetical protein
VHAPASLVPSAVERRWRRRSLAAVALSVLFFLAVEMVTGPGCSATAAVGDLRETPDSAHGADSPPAVHQSNHAPRAGGTVRFGFSVDSHSFRPGDVALRFGRLGHRAEAGVAGLVSAFWTIPGVEGREATNGVGIDTTVRPDLVLALAGLIVARLARRRPAKGGMPGQ